MIVTTTKQYFKNLKKVILVYTRQTYQYNINIKPIETDSNRLKPQEKYHFVVLEIFATFET